MARGRPNFLQVLTVILMIVALPFIVSGLLSVQSDTTDMRQWLPEGREEKVNYDEFVELFGPDDFVLISWPNITLTDSRLSRFARGLNHSVGDSAPEGIPRLVRRVLTGDALLERLTSEPIDLSRSRAIQRLRGTFVGQNGETTCALIEVTEDGNNDPHAVIDSIAAVAREECGLSRDELRLGGGIYEAVHIDNESQRSFRDYVGLSCLVGFVVAFISLRSSRLTSVVIFVGGYCGALSVALVYYGGTSLNALMLVLPTLIYVLVISSSVHLVNYYRDAIREGGIAGAAARAMAVGWLPCTLASVTTAIGMMSLATSQIHHVQSFGLFASTSLIVSLLVLLAFIPFALELWPAGGPSIRRHDDSKRLGQRIIDRVVQIILRHHFAVALSCVIIFLLLAIGLVKIRSSVKIEHMFRTDNELVQNYQWLEHNIGPLAAMEVVIRFGNDCTLTMLERLQLVQEIEHSVQAVPDVGNTISATTFAPAVPQSRGVGATIRRAVFNKRLAAAKPQLIEDQVIAEIDDAQLWRITARIPALRELDYQVLLNDVNHNVQSVLAVNSRVPKSTVVNYTGTILVMHESRRQLLYDLVKSFMLAFALICPLMMVILRSLSAGIVAMLPNVVPAVVIFGGMGWLGVPIDIGTVLTASVALGIAVDDTLHFLTWYRRGLDEGQNRIEAISTAYQRCAVAMIQTTMICGLGLLVFAGSSFVPTSRFVVLMFALLVAALLSDLIFLPAILAGPIGKLFSSSRVTVTSTTT